MRFKRFSAKVLTLSCLTAIILGVWIVQAINFTPDIILAAPGDQDDDGITDSEDACPTVAGIRRLAGCPEPTTQPQPTTETPIPTGTDTPTATNTPTLVLPVCHVGHATDFINIRESPSMQGAINPVQIPPMTPAAILSSLANDEGLWFWVNYNGVEGWVSDQVNDTFDAEICGGIDWTRLEECRNTTEGFTDELFERIKQLPTTIIESYLYRLYPCEEFVKYFRDIDNPLIDLPDDIVAKMAAECPVQLALLTHMLNENRESQDEIIKGLTLENACPNNEDQALQVFNQAKCFPENSKTRWQKVDKAIEDLQINNDSLNCEVYMLLSQLGTLQEDQIAFYNVLTDPNVCGLSSLEGLRYTRAGIVMGVDLTLIVEILNCEALDDTLKNAAAYDRALLESRVPAELHSCDTAILILYVNHKPALTDPNRNWEERILESSNRCSAMRDYIVYGILPVPTPTPTTPSDSTSGTDPTPTPITPTPTPVWPLDENAFDIAAQLLGEFRERVWVVFVDSETGALMAADGQEHYSQLAPSPVEGSKISFPSINAHGDNVVYFVENEYATSLRCVDLTQVGDKLIPIHLRVELVDDTQSPRLIPGETAWGFDNTLYLAMNDPNRSERKGGIYKMDLSGGCKKAVERKDFEPKALEPKAVDDRLTGKGARNVMISTNGRTFVYEREDDQVFMVSTDPDSDFSTILVDQQLRESNTLLICHSPFFDLDHNVLFTCGASNEQKVYHYVPAASSASHDSVLKALNFNRTDFIRIAPFPGITMFNFDAASVSFLGDYKYPIPEGETVKEIESGMDSPIAYVTWWMPSECTPDQQCK